jgi:hypothetical protein
MERAVISKTAVDHVWTAPKAKGVKIKRKIMPFSMTLSINFI